MKSVVIVYHSGYGHTKKQAQAVYEGANGVEGVKALMVSVSDVENHWEDLQHADAIIFGCPTYLGTLSAEFKKFIELTSKTWFEQRWLNKLAAGFTNSGNLNGDKLNTLTQLFAFASQHGMVWVSLGLASPKNVSTADRNSLNYLGSYIGAMAQSDSAASPDIAPPQGDLDTGKHLGKRVAEMALRFQDHKS